MKTDNQQLIEILEYLFPLICSIFPDDTAVGLADLDKYLKVKQSSTFKLSVDVGFELNKKGPTYQAILDNRILITRYPKEIYGFPIVNKVIPIKNPTTGNSIGCFSIAFSMEKESAFLEMAEDLKKFAFHIDDFAQHLAASSQEILASSSEVHAIMEKIQSKIKSMDDILVYIDSIANTTNLLGLNASIEAARAGQHGLGFAVVAEEIRKLAVSSKSSTQNINKNLLEIRQDIVHMVDLMTNFNEVSEEHSEQTLEISQYVLQLNSLSEKLVLASQNLNN